MYYKMTRIEKLYVDSRDRSSYESSNDFTVNLTGDQILKDTTSIYIDSMVFPNTQVPINSTNNKLYCNMRLYNDGDDQTIVSNYYFEAVIEEGIYTPDEICSVLPAAIMNGFNNTHPGLTDLTGVTCVFYQRTQRFLVDLPWSNYGGGSFAGQRPYFTIEDRSSSVFPNGFTDSLNYMLGFDDNSAYHISNVVPENVIIRASTEHVRLSGEQYLFLHCSAVSSSETSTKNSSNSDVLFKINLPIFGEIGYFNITGHNNSYISTNSPKISSLRFYITNSRDDLVPVDDYSFILGVNN